MTNVDSTLQNEQDVARAFSEQAPVFDELYGNDKIIQYKRERVRKHVLNYLPSRSNILELNAGTGEDAIYFARRGHHVHATDISAGMQEQLRNKVNRAGLGAQVSTEVCSFTELDTLKMAGPYDLIFSNFAGLNCTSELKKVLLSFDKLLKPAGIVSLVILPKFCLWETLLLFKGKFSTAFRRFFSRNGRRAKLNGIPFTCWYYPPSLVVNELHNNYKLLSIEGLCTIVPPSYVEGFAEKHPATFSFLVKQENRLKTSWPWKYIGDYYIITLQKNGSA